MGSACKVRGILPFHSFIQAGDSAGLQPSADDSSLIYLLIEKRKFYQN